MLKSYDKVLDNAAWIKQATIYKETTVTTKAKIFYFHGGGLLYGFRKNLPEKQIYVITQAGYEIISFDYPLAPAADLEQIVPDICDSAWRSVPSVTCLIPKRFSLTFPLLVILLERILYAVSHIFFKIFII